MPRRYELKRRAERQRATRRRIVDAAMELHATVGPARTSIKAVAERAGVQRHTVYRHFPTEDDLLGACAAAWDERHPFPDPSPWLAIRDPEERLRRALGDVYAYYRRVEPDLSAFVRDAELVPAVQRSFEEDARSRAELRGALAAGWGARGRRRRLLLAAIGHALEFETWRSLARAQGLADEQAAELMARLARSATA
jgi:AcrR family transcriptional regulator